MYISINLAVELIMIKPKWMTFPLLCLVSTNYRSLLDFPANLLILDLILS